MSLDGRLGGAGRLCRVLVSACFLLGLVSGCAGNKTANVETVFFPPPPDEPRIQYLTGISDSSDITGTQSNFSLVLTGAEKANVIRGLGKTFGITSHKGKIYIAATSSSQVIIIDFANKTFEYLKGAIKGPGVLKKPVSVALDDDGNLYVVDPGRKEVVVYNSAGDYVRTFGKENEKSKIVGIVAFGPDLYAIDNRSNEVKVFDRKTKELVTTFGKTEDEKGLSLPSYINNDAEGNLYITNIGSGKINKYDRDGHWLSSFGKFGDSFGEFARPRGVAIDDTGQVYVVDAGHQNVQVFNKDSRILTFFGNPGLPAGSLNLPAGIAVTKDNLAYFQKYAAPGFRVENVIFVINQYGKPSLSVYGFGKMQK